MPKGSDEPATIRPLNPQAKALIGRFSSEYVAREVRLSPKGGDDRELVTDMGTVVAYLAKYNYLVDGTAWEGERHQLYPYASLTDIANAIKESGLTIDEIRFPEPAKRNGLRGFLENYVVVQNGTPHSMVTFPSCQMLLKAHK